MRFMVQEVYHGAAYVVETTHGTEIVPAEYSLADPDSIDEEDLAGYCEGRIEGFSYRRGWLARMTAPGYLDSTDWTLHETQAEAIVYLHKTYGTGD